MNAQVLVTGGAGFIGSHLVDALVDCGCQVRVLDNLEPQVHGPLREQGKRPAYLHPGAELIVANLQDIDAVKRALDGVEVVFHEAAIVGVGQSMYEITRYVSANDLGTAVLLQAIIEMKKRPRKIITASSMSIYGEGAYECPEHGIVYPRLRTEEQLQSRQWEVRCPRNDCGQAVGPTPTKEDKPLYPTSVYAITKRDHEELFLNVGRAYGIPAVALRYFNTYGSRQALSNPYTGVGAIFSARLLEGKPPTIYEDGLQLRDFTHVSDIVQANLLVMDHTTAVDEVYNVASGQALTILQVAGILTGAMQHAGMLREEQLQRVQPKVTGLFRAGDIRHCTANIDRLQALGFLPRVRFDDGAAALVEWVRSQRSGGKSADEVAAFQKAEFEKAQQELAQRGLAR
jgi:dTDP-L-rhamnose 4-epimerase